MLFFFKLKQITLKITFRNFQLNKKIVFYSFQAWKRASRIWLCIVAVRLSSTSVNPFSDCLHLPLSLLVIGQQAKHILRARETNALLIFLSWWKFRRFFSCVCVWAAEFVFRNLKDYWKNILFCSLNWCITKIKFNNITIKGK